MGRRHGAFGLAKDGSWREKDDKNIWGVNLKDGEAGEDILLPNVPKGKMEKIESIRYLACMYSPILKFLCFEPGFQRHAHYQLNCLTHMYIHSPRIIRLQLRSNCSLIEHI